MTTSMWNEQEIRREFSDCSTLHDVIRKVELDFSQKGEVICEIRVNGVMLSEGDETKFAQSSAREINQLAIVSNRPADLLVEALNSALAFAPDLEASCLATAEAFRGSDLPKAQKRFNESLEGCQWFVDTLMHVRSAASGIGKAILQPERWFEAENMIARVIRELSEGYSKSDFVLVADLMEYELTGALSVWKESLKTELEYRAGLGLSREPEEGHGNGQSENPVGR